ncbi:MAG: hypothetical protein ACLFQY_07170, partial [Desulfococcaceae bacterium]
PRAEGPPGDYYINFQDPNGNPTDDPLVENDHTYMKIGWNVYDEDLGYGWFGDMAHVLYKWLSSGLDDLQRSVIYDDYGRQKTFEFDLPNGTYNVTVSVGWEGRTYSRNFIEIEGVSFINDEASDPYLVRTNRVTVSDSKLTMNMGIFDEYTMLNYLDIEAADTEFAKGDFDCDGHIDVGDAIAVLKTMAGFSVDSGACPDLNGDFSRDGRLGPEDAIAILQIAADLRLP